jgi:hypothetical protein
MRSIRIPAEIILTFPPQVKVTDELAEVAAFACEQHLNSIGVINYQGPMLETGTLSFGLRAHFHMQKPPAAGGLVVMRPHDPTSISKQPSEDEGA